MENELLEDSNWYGKRAILLKRFLILLRGTSHPRLKHVKQARDPYVSPSRK